MQAEADYLRNLAEPHLSPSNIESPGSAAEQQFHRNSYTTWAPPKFGEVEPELTPLSAPGPRGNRAIARATLEC